MSNLPPSNPRPSRDRDLGFDEFVAMLVAFGAVGAILWWGLSRKEDGFNFAGGEQPQPTQSVAGGLILPDRDANRDANQLPGAIGGISGGIGGVTRSPQTSPGSSPGGTLPGNSSAASGTAPVIVAPVPVPVDPSLTAAPSPSATVDPETTLVVPPPAAAPVQFSDIPADYWASPFIAALAQRGVLTALTDGQFQPDQTVNRGQYAALIETIFETQKTQAPIAFSDIPGGFWATPAIDTAVKAGFLKGYPDGTFQPTQPMTRLQVLASLTNGLKIPQANAPVDTVGKFQDSAQIPTWAVPAVASATQAAIVVNHPAIDVLNPNQPITRAELAAFVHQGLVAAGKLDPVTSNYIVRP